MVTLPPPLPSAVTPARVAVVSLAFGAITLLHRAQPWTDASRLALMAAPFTFGYAATTAWRAKALGAQDGVDQTLLASGAWLAGVGVGVAGGAPLGAACAVYGGLWALVAAWRLRRRHAWLAQVRAGDEAGWHVAPRTTESAPWFVDMGRDGRADAVLVQRWGGPAEAYREGVAETPRALVARDPTTARRVLRWRGVQAMALVVLGAVWAFGPQATAARAAVGSAHAAPGVYPVSVQAGYEFSCAVMSDTTARCWGRNAFGVLGDGTTENRATPVAVRGLRGVVQLALGSMHACARLNDGTVRCWGRNAEGELGGGNEGEQRTPTEVPGLTGVLDLAARGTHTCAVWPDRRVSCWGTNFDGELGNGTNTNHTTPMLVSGLTNAVELALGDHHTCARTGDGGVWCWGEADHGELGQGHADGSYRCGSHANYFACSLTPVRVQGAEGATRITADAVHTCALMPDGAARCWGWNTMGELGDGTTTQRDLPTRVRGVEGVVSITAGPFRTCAQRNDGATFCWGRSYGFTTTGRGIGRHATQLVPAPVTELMDVSSVALGTFDGCALRDRDVYCWNRSDEGPHLDGSFGIPRLEHPVFPDASAPSSAFFMGVRSVR